MYLKTLTPLLLLFLFACQAKKPILKEEAKQTAIPITANPIVQTVEDIKKEKLIQRALSLELDTPYTPPPGNPSSHHASGFAKILCSAVFITGLDFDFAAEAIGYFSSPYDERLTVAKREINFEEKYTVVTLTDGTVRKAVYLGSQGCTCLPEGEDAPYFTPSVVSPNLPDAAASNWPMGDVLVDEPFPGDIDSDQVLQAVEAAFIPAGGLTAAFVVTHKGRIVGEAYKDEISMHTPLESWSMGKSLTAMLVGVLRQKGIYTLEQPAPIPEWQNAGDPRQKIRIMDIMRMSSGLRFRAPQDPDFDGDAGYPDHLYVYTGSTNSFTYAASVGQQWKPNTVGRYRNSDPVLANYLVRLGVEQLGENYHSFPQRHLFDKIGVRHMIMETDPHGNFLLQGYEFGTARDWARLGNLVLQDGQWNGEQILPEGYLSHAMEIAPAWLADERPIYGGNFFWVNGDGHFPIPKDAIFMAGAGGQFTIIIPSHDLVVVRLGHYKGSSIGGESLNNALGLLMKAIPSS